MRSVTLISLLPLCIHREKLNEAVWLISRGASTGLWVCGKYLKIEQPWTAIDSLYRGCLLKYNMIFLFDKFWVKYFIKIISLSDWDQITYAANLYIWFIIFHGVYPTGSNGEAKFKEPNTWDIYLVFRLLKLRSVLLALPRFGWI